MDIILTEQFKAELKIILDFYASKSQMVANTFLDELFEKIESIAFMAYRFRKNRYFEKDNVRDLIFKGYVISFIIENETIKILSIYGHNLPKIN
ncbi:type II toxin-antitoxin system RelE/ParE family toxin [Campylobacter gastrosuis]|uniref:Type II toxin-antitoxin system RelE/ParE family toxin n=1 Tax=Campylobacter gastrosuis TaxID=2974576 RepID=A0ABT7HRV6_9BACT|nr:type II toxin-antitoxin system RelE/ParE family toxin [Campylobacter gastrosuis]MDL0089647.1 type II toxin-antitoxin system RelE/ParE family toxin [Campylobacter gastrosuis]